MGTLTTIVTVVTTLIVNFLLEILKKEFSWFQESKKFKRDYYYSQLEEIYLTLYAIISQSEYLRYFNKIEKDIDKIPFIELEVKKYETKINLKDGKISSSKTFKLNDAVSEFNKGKIIDIVLGCSKYASQKLLKLVVAYRFTHEYYTDLTIKKELLERFQLEELRLISKIVKTIVKETNEKLKLCNIEYDSNELESGILNTSIYENNSEI